MILRSATPADAELVAKLGRDSFIAAFGHLYSAADLASFLAANHAPGIVAAQLADPEMRCRIAEDAGAPLGFCKLMLRPAWPEHGAARFAIELKQLYCAAGTTGRGTGAALMDWALAEARGAGADAVRLSVWSENTGAQKFYARYGFTHLADIDFWVGSQRDDEYLYELRLN